MQDDPTFHVYVHPRYRTTKNKDLPVLIPVLPVPSFIIISCSGFNVMRELFVKTEVNFLILAHYESKKAVVMM